MPKFEFGGFIFDPSTGDLTQNGSRIRIDRQTSKLLQLLLDQAGELITREQIRQTLWPENELLNHDKVINNGISRLRYIFQDNARAPVYIERIPKRGYRLLIEVRELPSLGRLAASGSVHASLPVANANSANEQTQETGNDILANFSVMEPEAASSSETGLQLVQPHDSNRPEPHSVGPSEGLSASRNTKILQAISKRWMWVSLFACALIVCVFAATRLMERARVHSEPPATPAQPFFLGVAPFETNGLDADKVASSFRLDLTDTLSQLPQVRMRAAHSMNTLKLESAELPQQAAALGLDAIIFGRFSLEGKAFHLQLEIVRGKDATHLATLQYSGSRDELVSLRDKIQQNISYQLQLTSTGIQAAANTTDSKAYEAYLNGRYHFAQQSDEALGLAVSNFKEAVQQDPHFARAYAALGRNYLVMGIHQAIPRQESMMNAGLALDQAQHLAPNLAEVRATRGLLLFYGGWDFSGAERELRSAIQMDANQTSYREALARILSQTGRFDEALQQIDLAKAEDPGSIPVLSADAFIAGSAMRCDRMLAATSKLKTFMQDSPISLDIEANSLWTCARQEDAIKEWYRMARMEKDTDRMALESQGLKAFHEGGEKSYALLRLDVIHSGKRTLHPDDFQPMEWNVTAGKDREAIAILKRSFDDRDEQLLDIVMNPIYDRLEKYPDAQPMLAQIRGRAQIR